MPQPKSKISHQKFHAKCELTTSSVEETQAIGERLGKNLKPGDVVAFHGELGSGKTTLIQGIARGLGIDPERVKSPTFVLMREYPGEPPIIHIDGYRLEGAPAVSWLDLDLVFSPHKITLIEWAERFEGLLPEDRLAVFLEHVSTNRRRLRITASGPQSSARAAQLQTVDGKPLATDVSTNSSDAHTEESDHGAAGD